MERIAGKSNGKKPITPKVRSFIKGLVKGKTQTQAALDAGFGKGVNAESAAVQACRVLKNDNVKAAFDAALDRAGASLDSHARVIAEGQNATQVKGLAIGTSGEIKELEVPDHHTRLRAAELGLKARRILTPEQAASGSVMAVGFFIMSGRAERGLPSLEPTI